MTVATPAEGVRRGHAGKMRRGRQGDDRGGRGRGALQEAHGHRSRQAHHRPRYLRLRVLARPVEPLQPCFLFGFVLSKGVAGTIQLILF